MSLPFETGNSRAAGNGDRTVPETGPLEDLSALQRELHHLIHDQLQLAALEGRLAAHSLMAMISAAVCIGALLVLAWAGLMAAGGLGLIDMGFRPASVLLVLTALTAGLALMLRVFIFRRSRNLGFPATLRTLIAPASGNLTQETT